MRRSHSSRQGRGTFSLFRAVAMAILVVAAWRVINMPVSAVGQVIFGMAIVLTVGILAAASVALSALARDVHRTERGGGQRVRTGRQQPTLPHHTRQAYSTAPNQPKVIKGKVMINDHASYPPTWEDPQS